MRDYAKVSPMFWVGPTGKAIRKLGAEAQVVAMYLMSSPHSNMIGLYHLPAVYISADTGIALEGASKALASLSEVGFCTYDDDAEMVWVHEMARFQIADSLHQNDKQVKGINKEYMGLPECQQLRGFWLKYKGAFHLENERGIKGASKALRSQEQEQEQEQETEQEQEQEIPVAPDDATLVFTHWQQVMRKPRAIFDDKRKRLIRAHFKAGYNAQDLIDAITGCSMSPFHMGLNEKGQRYDSLGLILRDAGKIDQFTGYKNAPPAPMSRQDMVRAGNEKAFDDWIAEQTTDAIDGECSHA